MCLLLGSICVHLSPSDWMAPQPAFYLILLCVWEPVWLGAHGVLRGVSWTSFLTQSTFFWSCIPQSILAIPQGILVFLKSVAERNNTWGGCSYTSSFPACIYIYIYIIYIILYIIYISQLNQWSLANISEGERSTTTYWTIQQPSSRTPCLLWEWTGFGVLSSCQLFWWKHRNHTIS